MKLPEILPSDFFRADCLGAATDMPWADCSYKPGYPTIVSIPESRIACPAESNTCLEKCVPFICIAQQARTYQES
jgi:hypothetical protein